jgi:hypothetical protein
VIFKNLCLHRFSVVLLCYFYPPFPMLWRMQNIPWEVVQVIYTVFNGFSWEFMEAYVILTVFKWVSVWDLLFCKAFLTLFGGSHENLWYFFHQNVCMTMVCPMQLSPDTVVWMCVLPVHAYGREFKIGPLLFVPPRISKLHIYSWNMRRLASSRSILASPWNAKL